MEGESAEGGAEGWLLVRVHVPELSVHKNLQFPRDQLVWDVKQQCLAALPKELKESFNYGLFCPPVNGKAGKFLDEERRLGDYPFNGPVGYLELKYKRRVYKMLKLDEKALKALHSRTNLRRFVEHVSHAQVEKITKTCAKGLDPNFHCQETGETPLTIAATLKSPAKVLIALVNGGALLDYRTKDGSTAMHRAVEKNSLEAVKTLLELGASPNYKDGKGLTPLYLSVTNKTDPLLCETLLHDHATIGATDLQGWQEVHQACRAGLVQHVDHLLFYGADSNARNASGNTPLHVCAVNAQHACAAQLLFRGADKEALNYANQTPYQVAVIAGNLELAEVIKNYKPEEVVGFRGPPRYNPRRRSGVGGWLGRAGDRSSLASSTRIPAELDALLHRPFSSASSSISDSSHSTHEDTASIRTEKSMSASGSDAVSESSGVGTSGSEPPELAPGATAVCLQPHTPRPDQAHHLALNQGDIVEVSSVCGDGLVSGTLRSTGASGVFPAHCVHEVRLRQNSNTHQLMSSVVGQQPRVPGRREMALNKTYSATAPRIKKSGGVGGEGEVWAGPRTVVVARGRRGFGFVLRGARGASPLMALRPSPRCPALQYLDDVDAQGVAATSGLRRGDFLLKINGVDVTAASHETVVEMIRSSGDLVSLTVVSLDSVQALNAELNSPEEVTATPARAYAATLPRKTNGGRLAPAPPRRDPRTALSVGRARARSCVAGLENGGEKEENCSALGAGGKSTSAESVHNNGTGGSRAVNTLEELFQRQCNTQTSGSNSMMTRSAFQHEGSPPPAAAAAAAPPPGRVYASVAEMKRARGKLWSANSVGGVGGVCGVGVGGGGSLRREFHSTPDISGGATVTPIRTRSSEDVHVCGPPLVRPPPPPPASTFRPAVAAQLHHAPHATPTTLYRNNTATLTRGGAWARRTVSVDDAHYAQPVPRKNNNEQMLVGAPPIPEPDYSMSESESEPDKPPVHNHSGSSSGSSTMQHSFSVDEIQKIRTRLKASASCGAELGGAERERDDGDNSSSGVSSDQEAAVRPRRDKVSFCASVTVKSSNDVISTEPVHSSSESVAAPQPPPMQRHNSLTRKRATAVLLRGVGGRGVGGAAGRSAAERLGVDVALAPGRRRAAVSLAELPPPPEEGGVPPPPPPPLLAPPPQFSDRVRVVAATPKQLAHAP